MNAQVASCQSKSQSAPPWVLTLAVLLLLTPFARQLPELRRAAFCLPAAQCAAVFLGTTCRAAPDGYLLPARPLPVAVTLDCSAAGFFTLLVALAAGLLATWRPRGLWRHAAALLLFCYAATLVANTIRIVLGWHAGMWARLTLPEPYWGGIHLGVGTAVFVLALIAAHAAMRWWVGWEPDDVATQTHAASFVGACVEGRACRDRVHVNDPVPTSGTLQAWGE